MTKTKNAPSVDESATVFGPTIPENMTLDKIDASWELRVRSIDPMHVNDLLTSIRGQGLLEPLVVDLDNLLIAGNHRLAALKQLKEEHPTDFRRWFPRNQVPVNRLAFAAKDHMKEAIAASVAENQKRQNLDPRAVKEYREKLAKHYDLRVGRPRSGETAVMQMLAIAFKASPRYLRKVIQNANGGGPKKPGPKDLISKPEAIPQEFYLPKGTTAESFRMMNRIHQIKSVLVSMRLSDAELQQIAVWCNMSRRERNAELEAGDSVKSDNSET